MTDIYLYNLTNKIHSYNKEVLLKNLSHYLNKKPSEVKINTTENGKPWVSGVFYSISHSRNLLVQLFSKQGDVGIDIEFINKNRDFLKLAQRYFHHNEFTRLNSMPIDKARVLFFQLWSAKEAVCKLEGGRLWFYLKKNLLLNDRVITQYENISLNCLNLIKDFSFCIATQFKPSSLRVVHE